MVPMCSSNYGYRCLAAINAFEEAGICPDACVFVAGEDANSASEIDTLRRHYEAGGSGYDLVIGERTWAINVGRPRGWTIEPQILVPLLSGRVSTLVIGKSPQLAGVQKVSGIGLRRSLWIGGKIFGAGLRVRWRAAKMIASGSAGSIGEG